MRAAIPLTDDGIARVFDTATRLLIVDLNGVARDERVEVPTFVGPAIIRAREIASLGIDVVVCERISHTLAARIRDQGIDIESPGFMDVDDAISYMRRHQPTCECRQIGVA